MSRRPGTVKAVYDIALPYPRDAFALRGASEFVELEATIWNALRDEFRAPVEGGGGPPRPPPPPPSTRSPRPRPSAPPPAPPSSPRGGAGAAGARGGAVALRRGSP